MSNGPSTPLDVAESCEKLKQALKDAQMSTEEVVEVMTQIAEIFNKIKDSYGKLK